ncbi:MAG: argininosuccinate synthase [Planctomycetes bacterium]|nr:argininosuccinate synthase [Planctomycetota bacterium]
MSTVVLAFSGGLDTSFCAGWLVHELGHEVVTVCVDTGGFDAAGLDGIRARALACGASEHYTVDARQVVWDRFVSYLVMGDVLRGGVYPVSVAAERTAQAEAVVRVAREVHATAIAHGSTGAGNDQIRFDGALAALAPDLQILAPVRELHLSRQAERDWLVARGVPVSDATVGYSLNAGLFGTTIGGRETHDPWTVPPESVYAATANPETNALPPEELVLGFEQGRAVSLDGERLAGPELVAALNARAGAHGFGRGIHLGDTILGVKGRVVFEAPGPLVLVKAHRELSKLVLTKWQAHWMRQAGDFWGMLLHEGCYHDPVLRDLEALLESSNRLVAGEARVRLAAGTAEVVGVRSPHSLMDAATAVYGESASAWTGAEAAGFGKIHAMPAVLAGRRDLAARERAASAGAGSPAEGGATSAASADASASRSSPSGRAPGNPPSSSASMQGES